MRQVRIIENGQLKETTDEKVVKIVKLNKEKNSKELEALLSAKESERNENQ